MRLYLILLIALASYLSCSAQQFKLEVRGKKIYVKSGNRAIDSIGLFSPSYSKQMIHGSSIYYTDGIITPDRITIKLFRMELNGSKEVKNAVIRSLYLEREEFIDIKLSSEKVTLRFRDENGRKKVTHKVQTLLE